MKIILIIVIIIVTKFNCEWNYKVSTYVVWHIRKYVAQVLNITGD